jgi:hypothetical protein
MHMAKVIYHADDGREFHISKGDFIYIKTQEGDERNGNGNISQPFTTGLIGYLSKPR